MILFLLPLWLGAKIESVCFLLLFTTCLHNQPIAEIFTLSCNGKQLFFPGIIYGAEIGGETAAKSLNSVDVINLMLFFPLYIFISSF